jgi:hypothetical protein
MYDLKTKWIKLNYEVERLNVYILKLETEIKFLRTEKNELEAECEKLRNMLLKALGIIREGKALFAPNTTNAFIDDWIKDVEELDNNT